jgi:PAS domain S-box-containing protein
MESFNTVHERHDQRLDYLLNDLMSRTDAIMGCVYGYSRDMREIEVYAMTGTVADNTLDKLAPWMHSQLNLLRLRPNDEPQQQIISRDDIALRSAVIRPVYLFADLIGAIALFSTQWTPPDLSPSQHTITDTMIAVMQNKHLAERFITTDAIAATAQAITRTPSPQGIVEILRDYLFDAHVSACMIALFGPVQPEKPDTDFEYLEIAGSWSRFLGAQFSVGLRYPINTLALEMAKLYKEKHITYANMEEAHTLMQDPLIRVMVQIGDMKSLTGLLLESDERKLGVLLIAHDQVDALAPPELRTYQIVTEFLTVTTVALAFQRQADFVQQGRAALLDAVTDGVVMVLPDDNASVLTVNTRFKQMFGLKRDTVRGQTLWDVLQSTRIPTTITNDLSANWQHLTPEDPRKLEGEFQMTNETGGALDVQWYSAPVYRSGSVIGRIYTFHEITAERAAERLRHELLSRISHELRTPLTSIRGFARFILDAHDENELPAMAREYTEIIHSSALHLNTLFTDMIELTRANAGQIGLTKTTSHITDVVLEIVARLEPQYKARDQKIIMDLDDDIPKVTLDMDRIGQVLTNLVNNAIKYGPEGGKIRIFTELAQARVELPHSAPEDTVRPCVLISIIDQGDGLTQETADKVFLPFYRTAEARRGKVEGAGLGLAISHTIVELHRGRLWAQAATKKEPGGRFFFTIPLDDAY